jgi:hypothetical protein
MAHAEEESSLSKRRMLDFIKTIDEGDPETLLLHMNTLTQVLNSDEMPFTVVQPLVLILTRDELLDSERTDKVYNLVMESKFLRNPRNLRAYILKLCSSKHPTSEEYLTSLSPSFSSLSPPLSLLFLLSFSFPFHVLFFDFSYGPRLNTSSSAVARIDGQVTNVS